MKPRFGISFYNRLKLELGEIDASAACLELAMREFIAASTLSANPTTFIQTLSSKHGIRVDVFDTAFFMRRGSALRIIGITQAFEGFLDRMIENHPRIGNRDGRRGDETLLNFVVRKLDVPKHVAASFTYGLDYKLYSYFPLLRKGIAHPTHPTAASASLIELQNATAADTRYVRLAAPNSAHGLNFDDYVLFSRASKSVAAQLCQISGLSEPEIMDWLEKQRDRSGSIERQVNNVRTNLRIAFGLDLQSAEPFVVNLGLSGQ
jgi:hypothetical protein